MKKLLFSILAALGFFANAQSQSHLAQAINLDWLNQTAFINGLAKLNKQKTYYVYCRSGRRSQAAAGKLKAEGFQVIDLKGGYLHWVEVGMPVVK